VEEFEQWASAQQQPEGSHRSLRNKPELHQDCVDRIVSLAYNYGVTLVDLDQVALVEKFVSKAISLLRFASDSLQSWLPRMQVPTIYHTLTSA